MLGISDISNSKTSASKLKLTTKNLCDFLKNLENDGGTEDVSSLANWYIAQYEGFPITIDETLCLWKDVYSLSPFIQEFNLSILKSTNDETFSLYLHLFVASMKVNRDKAIKEYIIKRCVKSLSLSVKLFWNLAVEVERNDGKDKCVCYSDIASYFMNELKKSEKGEEYRKILKRQGNLVEKLVKILGTIRQSRSKIAFKRTLLTSLLNDPKNDLFLFDPVPLPVRPDIFVVGIVPEQCNVFNSQLNPLLLTFMTKTGQLFKCIFKSGDDLRQDSSVMTLFKMMEKILLKGNIKSNIITYDVRSTGLEHGFVEYIFSTSFYEILQEKEGLHERLSRKNEKTDKCTKLKKTKTTPSCENGKSSVKIKNSEKQKPLNVEKMEAFITSTATSAVITYLLCVGDRHFDNMLLTVDCEVFHVDFGFLGREPKPFAPALKLCPEIIDVMGGKHSGYYATFLNHCINVFVCLRKNADIFLDAIQLVSDIGILDVNEVLMKKVETRFALDKSESAATQLLISAVEEGFENVLPKMMDNFHHTWKSVF